jgi:hypothetical protein
MFQDEILTLAQFGRVSYIGLICIFGYLNYTLAPYLTIG